MKLLYPKRLILSAVAFAICTVAGCSSQKPVADKVEQTSGEYQAHTIVAEHADIPAAPREFRAVWLAEEITGQVYI